MARPKWPKRSHCRNGHKLTAANTYVYTNPHDGWVRRMCKQCRADAAARSRKAERPNPVPPGR